MAIIPGVPQKSGILTDLLIRRIKRRLLMIGAKRIRAYINLALLLGLFVVILICVIQSVSNYYGVGINTTPSEVEGLYVYSPLPQTLQLGDFVMFTPPAVNWIDKRDYFTSDDHLIKRIGAVPGEYLFTQNRTIFACNTDQFGAYCRTLGTCLEHDPKGRPVYCQHWHFYKIPKDEYYLMSQRVSESLDSRYFGLVSKRNIQHKVQLLWGM